MKQIKWVSVLLVLVMLILSGTMPVLGASVEENKANKEKQRVAIEVSKRVHTNSPVEKGSKKIDDLISSEVSVTTLTTENLQYIRTDTLSAETKYATAYASFKLYKVLVDDPNYDYYIVWMKGTGISKKDVMFGDDGNVYEVRVGIQLNRDTDTITDWEPVSDVSTGTPTTITASLQVEHNGVSAGISETYTLYPGHIGPHSLTSSTFKAHWNGNYEGSVGVIAGVEFRVPKGAGWDYTYTLYLDSGQF